MSGNTNLSQQPPFPRSPPSLCHPERSRGICGWPKDALELVVGNLVSGNTNLSQHPPFPRSPPFPLSSRAKPRDLRLAQGCPGTRPKQSRASNLHIQQPPFPRSPPFPLSSRAKPRDLRLAQGCPRTRRRQSGEREHQPQPASSIPPFTTLPFVIPSEAEGSAVGSGTPWNSS